MLPVCVCVLTGSDLRPHPRLQSEETQLMEASQLRSWQRQRTLKCLPADMSFLFRTFPARLPELWSKYFKAVGRQQIARLHLWTCVRKRQHAKDKKKMMWRCVASFSTNNRCNKVCDTVSWSGFISWHFSLIWKQPLFVRPVKFTVAESGERKWWASSESNCWHDDCARERIILWLLLLFLS